MTEITLAEAVADMRAKQKAYFKLRTKEALIASKQAEKIVDDMLKEYV